jgi:hypothetical protein
MHRDGSLTPAVPRPQLIKGENVFFVHGASALRHGLGIRPRRRRYDDNRQNGLQRWRRHDGHRLTRALGFIAPAHVLIVVDFFDIVFETRRVTHGLSASGYGAGVVSLPHYAREPKSRDGLRHYCAMMEWRC